MAVFLFSKEGTMPRKTPEVPQSQEAAHIPESEFTWGIPTRSDVKDPEYHEILRLEELNEKIQEWRWPTSSTFLHNHVVAALRFAGEDPLKAEQVYKGGEYKGDFREFLNPQTVLDYSLQALSGYEQALTEARPYIPRLEKEDYDIETTVRYPKPLPEGVREEKIILKWYREGKEKGWRYTFKPWGLISRELTSLREDLEEALDTEENPIKQIQVLWQVLDSHDRSLVKELASGALRIPLEKTSYAMERDKRTETGRLHSLNAQIAAESDVYVRFDEIYLVQKRRGKVIIQSPLQGIVDPERRFDSGGLWIRSGVRDYLGEQFTKERRIVFNGIEIVEDGLAKVGEGGYTFGLKTSQESPLWIINLIAKPVEINGEVRMPEEWAVRERDMVNEYRGLVLEKALQIKPVHPVVEKLLSTYEGYRRELTRPEEQLDHLLYALREGDWKKRHGKI